jgi:hypothetical protein
MAGTEYEKSGEVDILLREGKEDEALQRLKALPANYGLPLLGPCLGYGPATKGNMAAQKLRSALMADHDPAVRYWLAGWDSFCGQTDLAQQELRRAIAQNYCAYPQMETDPLLARVRATPQFSEIRSLGISCQERFLEHRKQRSSE